MEISGVLGATGSSQTIKARATDIQTYALRVQAALGPKHLDGHGLKGRVMVAYSISDDGTLQGAHVAQSSGEHRLDTEALQIVGKATFPSPPTGMSVVHRSYVSVFTFE